MRLHIDWCVIIFGNPCTQSIQHPTQKHIWTILLFYVKCVFVCSIMIVTGGAMWCANREFSEIIANKVK